MIDEAYRQIDRTVGYARSMTVRDQLKEIVREDDDPRNYVSGTGKVVVDESELDEISRRWAERYGEEYMEEWVDDSEFDETDREFIRQSLDRVPESHLRDPSAGGMMLTGAEEDEEDNRVKSAVLKGAAVVGLGATFVPWALAAQPVAGYAANLASDGRIGPEGCVEHPDRPAESEGLLPFEPFSGFSSEERDIYPEQKEDIREMMPDAPDYYFSDRDGDGVIYAKELMRGTDPRDPDTDNDGLLDGWELYGVRMDGEKIPLDEMGADPLRKDVFVQVTGEELPERAIEIAKEDFRDAPVSNPDGSEGIDLHVDQEMNGEESLSGEDLGGGQWAFSEGCAHPGALLDSAGNYRSGVFHFAYVGELPDIDPDDHSRTQGYGEVNGDSFIIREKFVENSRDLHIANVFNHELGHNILGTLDPSNRASDSPYHSRYDFGYVRTPVCRPANVSACYPGSGCGEMVRTIGGAMYHTVQSTADYHRNTWQEIDRDGLLGLPGQDWEPVEKQKDF